MKLRFPESNCNTFGIRQRRSVWSATVDSGRWALANKCGRMRAMERQPRDFKGVWIPREIWLSRQLSLMEKVLFVEIHSLDNASGCFASNAHFAEFFGVSDRQIRTHIGSLKEKRFVTVSIQNRYERVIRTTGRHARVHDHEVFRPQRAHSEQAHTREISVDSARFTGREWQPRDFKGVWIPKEIWLSPQLTLMEKVLFVEIHSLDNERGCFASNAHFAGFFDVGERQIRT